MNLHYLLFLCLFLAGCSKPEPVHKPRHQEVKMIGYLGTWAFRETEGVLVCTTDGHIAFYSWDEKAYALEKASLKRYPHWIDAKTVTKVPLNDMIQDARKLCH